MKFNRKVAVTLGDPSGVGPEVFLKSLENKTLKENLENILVVSDPMVLKRLSSDISYNLKLHDSNGFSDLKADSINFFSIKGCHDYNLGSPNQENANYILSCIDKGIEMCINDNSNLVTGPINKLQIANYDKNFNDHTAYLKTTTEVDNVLMVLTNPKLTVGLLTTHLPLKEVANQVTKSNLTNAIAIGYNAEVSISNAMVLGGIGADAVKVGIGTTSPARSLHINDVIRLEPISAPPTNPSEGDIYMDSGSHKLMVFDGTTWHACW